MPKTQKILSAIVGGLLIILAVILSQSGGIPGLSSAATNTPKITNVTVDINTPYTLLLNIEHDTAYGGLKVNYGINSTSENQVDEYLPDHYYLGHRYTALLSNLKPNTTYKVVVQVINEYTKDKYTSKEYTFTTQADYDSKSIQWAKMDRQWRKVKDFTATAVPAGPDKPGVFNITWSNAYKYACVSVEPEDEDDSVSIWSPEGWCMLIGESGSKQVQIIQLGSRKRDKTGPIKFHLRVIPTALEYEDFSPEDKRVARYATSIRNLTLPLVGPMIKSFDKSSVRPGEIITMTTNEFVNFDEIPLGAGGANRWLYLADNPDAGYNDNRVSSYPEIVAKDPIARTISLRISPLSYYSKSTNDSVDRNKQRKYSVLMSPLFLNLRKMQINVVSSPTQPDYVQPTISDVTVSDVTDTGATITWKTDEPTDSLVKYGDSWGDYWYRDTQYDATMTTNHSMRLTNLLPRTKQELAIVSYDEMGNWGSHHGPNFDSLNLQSPPANVNIDTQETSAVIAWTTKDPTDTRLEYGTTARYGFTKYDHQKTTSHVVTLTNLIPDMVYYLRFGGGTYTLKTLGMGPDTRPIHIELVPGESVSINFTARKSGDHTVVLRSLISDATRIVGTRNVMEVNKEIYEDIMIPQDIAGGAYILVVCHKVSQVCSESFSSVLVSTTPLFNIVSQTTPTTVIQGQKLVVKFNATKQAWPSIRLIRKADGERVLHRSVSAVAGENTQELNIVSSIPPGEYTVAVCDTGRSVCYNSAASVTVVKSDSYTWSYSPWLACSASGQQTRTASCLKNGNTVSSSECANIINLQESLTRSCTPPTVSTYTYSWKYGTFNTCQSNSTQTRTATCTKYDSTGADLGETGNINCTTPAITTQSCVYTPPTSTYTYRWRYNSYSACQSNGTQTRTAVCEKYNSDGIDMGPAENTYCSDPAITSQSCVYTGGPTCRVNFDQPGWYYFTVKNTISLSVNDLYFFQNSYFNGSDAGVASEIHLGGFGGKTVFYSPSDRMWYDTDFTDASTVSLGTQFIVNFKKSQGSTSLTIPTALEYNGYVSSANSTTWISNTEKKVCE